MKKEEKNAENSKTTKGQNCCKIRKLRKKYCLKGHKKWAKCKKRKTDGKSLQRGKISVLSNEQGCFWLLYRTHKLTLNDARRIAAAIMSRNVINDHGESGIGIILEFPRWTTGSFIDSFSGSFVKNRPIVGQISFGQVKNKAQLSSVSIHRILEQ